MKLRFPERTDTHVTEAESWRLLQNLAPKEWIVREVSERDYGIDAYIELVSKGGQITGELMSAQLKGVQEIDWKPSDGGFRVARSPSVKTTTAAYWLGLPVPVFLLVADLSAGNIYFVAVKEGIRRRFEKLESQDTISFKLVDKFDPGCPASAPDRTRPRRYSPTGRRAGDPAPTKVWVEIDEATRCLGESRRRRYTGPLSRLALEQPDLRFGRHEPPRGSVDVAAPGRGVQLLLCLSERLHPML
jgi:hypothetical protein